MNSSDELKSRPSFSSSSAAAAAAIFLLSSGRCWLLLIESSLAELTLAGCADSSSHPAIKQQPREAAANLEHRERAKDEFFRLQLPTDRLTDRQSRKIGREDYGISINSGRRRSVYLIPQPSSAACERPLERS